MRIVINMDEGLVQAVLYSADDDPDLGVIIIDCDTEGAEDEEVVKIEGSEYVVTCIEPIKDLKTVNKVFKKVWG